MNKLLAGSLLFLSAGAALADLSPYRKAQLEELAFYISNPAYGVGDVVLVHKGTMGCGNSSDLLSNMALDLMPGGLYDKIREKGQIAGKCGYVPEDLHKQVIVQTKGPNALTKDASGAQGWVALHTLRLEKKAGNQQNSEEAVNQYGEWVSTPEAIAFFKVTGLMGNQFEEDRLYRMRFMATDFEQMKIMRSTRK